MSLGAAGIGGTLAAVGRVAGNSHSAVEECNWQSEDMVTVPVEVSCMKADHDLGKRYDTW